MAYLVRHMTHKANNNGRAKITESLFGYATVRVEGFKQSITFENTQNIKSPYTPENIAEITYEIVSGFPDVSKRLLNQFKIHVNCWSESDADDWMAASVKSKGWSDVQKGFINEVELGVQFDGTLKSIVNFAHELVHIAQFASRRLRTLPYQDAKGEWRMKNAFAVAGKVIQKADRNNLPYEERVWEWEAYGMQGVLANAIMRMLGGDSIEMIQYTSKTNAWLDFCYNARNNLTVIEHCGWEHFGYEVKSAYGEAKKTKGMKKLSDMFVFQENAF